MLPSFYRGDRGRQLQREEHVNVLTRFTEAIATDTRITPDRFKLTRPDRIVFTDLTKADTMVIQCNATNKHGYLWGEAYVNVICTLW